MNKTLETLKKAGYKFNKKDWPLVPVQKLRELGITPEQLGKDFRQATLYQIGGPNYCLGFKLEITPGQWRPKAIKN
jgi:hypothetical protein